MGLSTPNITALVWTDAKEVLPHEAHDFTPWLAGNLDLLGDALGLDEMALVQTEWKVDSFALDILARGRDADGEVTVVIENQYGQTDHRHLGQILTYAAHAAAGGHRVLAVWITEEVRPAHLAAVEFVNRVAASDESSFGMVLMRVRFAPAPSGWHVDFQVDSEPNTFLGSSTTTGGGGSTAGARGAFLEAVVAQVDPAVASAGVKRSGGINRKQGAAIYRFPLGVELGKYATMRIVIGTDFTNTALYIQSRPTAEENRAIAVVVREHAEPWIAHYGLRVDEWFGSAETTKRERIITHFEHGYLDGQAAQIAKDAATVVSAWARLLAEHPLTNILEQAAQVTPNESV
ncbi:hypothetical protein [Longivirga aurantiaca]|uniref:DUF4268 domain-containing protein n=1 Tax=Longivirga aurantiaca TaxID=1837743 RepID=A0ABW1T007_9ACTN